MLRDWLKKVWGMTSKCPDYHLFQVLMARIPRRSRKEPHLTKMNGALMSIVHPCEFDKGSEISRKAGKCSKIQVDCSIHDHRVNWHQTHFFSSKRTFFWRDEAVACHEPTLHGPPPLVYLMTSPQPAIGPRAIPTLSTGSSQYVD